MFRVTVFISLGGKIMISRTIRNTERNQLFPGYLREWLVFGDICGNIYQIWGVVHKNKPGKKINFPLLGAVTFTLLLLILKRKFLARWWW